MGEQKLTREVMKTMSLSAAQLKRCKEGKKTFGTQNMVNPKAYCSP